VWRVLQNAVVVGLTAWPAVANEVQPLEAAEATPVGAATCEACHTTAASHWKQTIHARISARPRNALRARGCEACHGAGSLHVANPQDPSLIVGFSRGSGIPNPTRNAMCLQCHAGGARVYWTGSIHETQDLACSDCHNPMAGVSATGLLARGNVSRTCFTCHPAQRAQFRKRSHMPLLEGKIACSDCHAPHGSPTDPLLRGDSVNQMCTSCHAAKRGPFLWEHAPAREDCSTCHTPHGSNHAPLLKARAHMLCQECHQENYHPSTAYEGVDTANGTTDYHIQARSCMNCHTEVHGSNHPSGARWTR
jgi:DmsE family decaheme c-type cytochrome